MDWKNIREELLRLSEVVDGWSDRKDIDALDRDWALEKLRSLYEAIRFADSERRSEPLPVVPESETASDESSFVGPADLDLSGMLALEPEVEPIVSDGPILSEIPVVSVAAQSDGPIPLAQELRPEPKKAAHLSSKHKTEPEVPASTGSHPKIETLQRPQQSRQTVERLSVRPEPRPVPEPLFVSEPEPEPLHEAAEHSKTERESITETVRTPTSGFEPAAPISESHSDIEFAAPEPDRLSDRGDAAPATATLFDTEDEDDAARHRRKQRVIMSLYGDDTLSEPVASATSAPVARRALSAVSKSGPEKNRRNGSVTFEEVTVETVVSNEPVSMSGFPDAASGQGANVLGETIGQDVQTLADTVESARNVASTLRSKRLVSDLRQAIGINDKFLLIRDLFDGDSDAYDAVMQKLNGFESLDDCVIYLTENYAWNANSESVRMLMDLLERKFA